MDRISRSIRIAAFSAIVLVAAATPTHAAEPLSPDQTTAVETVIRDYLLQNPEIIAQAIEALQNKRKAAEQLAITEALDSNRVALMRDPGSPITGDVEGDVSVIEFFDYRCGVCKRVHPIVAQLMKGDPKLRRVYKEWPILGPDSVFASRAALASRAQGKYKKFHDAMMEFKGSLSRQAVLKVAKRVGLDSDRLLRDLESPEISGILSRNFKLAEALKISGTPSFVIGNEVVRGGRDISTMQRIVAAARAGK